MLSSAQEPRRRGAIMALLALLIGSSGALVVMSLYPVANLEVSPPPFLIGVITLSILVTDLVSFKMRPGTLRISLILAALVPAALLLPTPWALIATSVALTLSALARHVNPLRGVYDVWSGTFAAALMLLTYHTIAGDYAVSVIDPSFLDPQPIFAVLVAAGVHALLAFYLAFSFKKVLKGESYEEFVSINAAPYFWGAFASALLGALVVAVVASAPILLPLTILPAWAIVRMAKTLIYSRQADSRTSQVSEIAKILNSNLEPVALIESFLELSRRVHGASLAVAIHELQGQTEVLLVSAEGSTKIEATPELLELLAAGRAGQGPAVINYARLPKTWQAGLMSPLDVDGVHYGVALLGWSSPASEVDLDLPLWGSLTAALSSALSQAALFAQIEAITASQSEAVIALNHQGEITFLNPAAHKLLGLEEDFIRGLSVEASLKIGTNLLSFKEMATLQPSTGSVEYRDATLLSNGKTLVVNCTVSPMRSSRSTSSDWMSRGVVVVIEDRTASRAAARALAESQEQIIALGRALQASLLPAALPLIPGATLAARYHAAAGGLDIGGDFYDVLNTRDGSYNIIMGDVCGRGPEAAALTSLTRHTLRGAVGTDPSPISALRRLNEAVVAESDNMFCTVAMGRITAPVEGKSTLRVTLGGHPPVLVIRKEGGVEEINPEGTLIGAFEEIELTEETVELYPGDAVVFYTDGVLEARGPDGAFFENSGLHALLASQAGAGAEAIAESLDGALKDFQGGILQDDTAFIIFSVN